MFQLKAQVMGQPCEVTVSNDGTGITVHTPSGIVATHTLNQAIEIARRHMGLYLQRAERPGVPWGLYVSAGEAAAVYGEWPLLPGPPEDRPRRESPVAKIHKMWRDGDGPLAALDNALTIVRYYTQRSVAA